MEIRTRSGIRPRGRKGLTLMELVVVMAILIALAAILIPLFPSMIERAHKASESTNGQELTKAIGLYQAMNGSYPDGWDLLTDGTTLVNFLPSAGAASPMFYGETATADPTNTLGFNFPFGGYVSPAKLDAAHGAPLAAVGINNLIPMAPSSAYTGAMGWTPTFNPYATDNPTPLSVSSGPVAAFLFPSAVQRANLSTPSLINPKSNTQFIVFGVGRFNSMIGQSMYSVPNLFPDDTVHENPAFVYERFGAVFQLEDQLGNVLPAAIFVGACSIESDGFESVDKTLESYYQRVKQAGFPGGSP